MKRLAIVCSHPIQYYVPWFQFLASKRKLQIKVFYLWDFGSSSTYDPEFGQTFTWDLDLLSGYDYSFIRNYAPKPGTSSFWGLINPSLPRAVLEFNPSACLLYGYNSFSHLNLILRLKKYVPLIFRGDSHLLGRRSPTGIKRKLLSSLYSNFSAFLSVGKNNRSYFEHFGVASDKLYHCPHAVDNERFSNSGASLRGDLEIPEEDLVFLFVGKFVQKKCPLELLEAFVQSAPRSSHLLFIGDGPLQDTLQRRAEGHTNVHVLSFQNQTQMPSIYKTADVIVLPSFGPYETWGLCINEAFNSGTAALVSSHVGCAADLVQGQDTGLIFEAGNTEALTATLRQFYADSNSLQRWQANAQSTIQHYSYTQQTEALHAALERVS
ncbi:MAG: glycosyltransferase family 4 protein [Bdellovibrionales bacterium]|nr:glycosyltransferase family 4 protein [Bdellovibrionales bacterium]